VTEYAGGSNLSQKIERRRDAFVSKDKVLCGFIQFALAIKYVHDRNILPRDLKTQNVFLKKEHHLKLGNLVTARPRARVPALQDADRDAGLF
jgi:NIMA (never in mitosis gene a)-related kinase